ncbi:MAG: DUF3244 domain-containing protein [Bacteroides sp.]|nr:DUF3244 domain-containing protein [Bacteroides sp.]
MKKILVTLFVLCFASISLLAITNREIAIRSANRPLMPRPVVEFPKVYQSDASISISLPEVASYVTISIINKETGQQVYMMTYSVIQNVQIDLSMEDEGDYSIELGVDGTEYTGDFLL